MGCLKLSYHYSFQEQHPAHLTVVHHKDKDHLGSILDISDATGIAVEERHFTPWGEVEEFKKNGDVLIDFTDAILSIYGVRLQLALTLLSSVNIVLNLF